MPDDITPDICFDCIQSKIEFFAQNLNNFDFESAFK